MDKPLNAVIHQATGKSRSNVVTRLVVNLELNQVVYHYSVHQNHFAVHLLVKENAVRMGYDGYSIPVPVKHSAKVKEIHLNVFVLNVAMVK